MTKHSIELLFPTSVYFDNIDRDFTKKELDCVKKHSSKTYKNAGNVTSNNTYILNEPEFVDLKKIIEHHLQKYVDTIYKPKYLNKIFVTQSWLNWTKKGEYHHKHEHPNSFISGVIYINADEKKDKITFFNDRYHQLYLATENYDIYNSNSWWYSVGTKNIVLFPSYLTHCVENVITNETRISLAFNSFIKGTFGDKKELTEFINE